MIATLAQSRTALTIIASAAGLVFGFFLVATQSAAMGGWTGLLHVGDESHLRSVIEDELGAIPLVPGGGHDGQISYGIALDLDGDELADRLDHPGYRYRRILYPAMASLFGALDGSLLLVGMVVLATAGMGLASGGIADLAATMGLPRWTVLGILANPGAWLAVRLLTPDALALGLAIAGLALAVRHRHGLAVLVLGAAALTKDQYLLVAVSLALFHAIERRGRLSLWYAAMPAVPLAAWSAWISARLGAGFTPRGNLGAPFAGIAGSLQTWSSAPMIDTVYGVLTLALIVVAAISMLRAEIVLLHAVGWPWVVLAILSSTWVWDFGNNALRAFAFLGVIGALALGATGRARRSSRRAASRMSTAQGSAP